MTADSLLLTPEDASGMSTETLETIRTTVSVELDYRRAARSLMVPPGYVVVNAGRSRPGDRKWCWTHGTWEAAEEGHAYWSFVLLCRSEEDS